MKNKKTTTSELNNKGITRKEAIKKAGVTALTATTLFFLDTKKSSATSPPPPTVTTDTEQGAQKLGGTRYETARLDRK